MANAGRIRIAGMVCIVGSVLWVIVLLADVLAHQTVYGSTASYRIWEGLLILVQALLLFSVAGLAWSGAAGTGWLGRIGLGVALLGRTSFLLAEILSFARGKDDEIFLPLGAVLTAIGMLLFGIAVVRAHRWNGWHRFAPLLAGIYPFIFMFPILAATGTPPEATIALWGIPWLLLGLAMRAQANAAETLQQQVTLPAYS